jgi:hypothetical protein
LVLPAPGGDAQAAGGLAFHLLAPKSFFGEIDLSCPDHGFTLPLRMNPLPHIKT